MEDNEIKLVLAKVDTQYKIIDTKLDAINNHLGRINGSVQKHETQINEALIERARYREVIEDTIEKVDIMKPKVRKLEDQQLTSRGIKKWIATSVILTGTVIGLFYTLYQLFQHAGG